MLPQEKSYPCLNKTNGWRYSSMHFYTLDMIHQIHNLMMLISYDRSLGKLMSWHGHGGKGESSYLMHVSCTTSISGCRYVQCQHRIHNYSLHLSLQVDNNVEPSNKNSDIPCQYLSFYFSQC
jgi:hypothetical protein